MGRRLQAGAGRTLSLRLRILATAAGIVAVSLLLSGTLTWFLVRNLEEQTTKDNLARAAAFYAPQVAVLAATPAQTAVQLNENFNRSQLAGERVIVVRVDPRLLNNSPETVIFDSDGQLQFGQGLGVRNDGAPLSGTGNADLGGTRYVFGYARSRGYVVFVMRRQADVIAQATSRLLPNLLVAGGVSLAIAFLLALLMSRAMTRPLTELASASEDIARGNYERRVKFEGTDEIGIVGRAFNRMAEAVERARATQRDFLANVSHELKTPLTSLIGFSQALVDGSLHTPEEQRRAASILHEESRRMLRMSQELLDLARVESGQVPLTLQPVDLVAMVEQELDLVRKRAEERRLSPALEGPRDLPPALADPERLHQILDNVLDNAVKYAPAASRIVVEVVATPSRLEVRISNPVAGHRPDPERMFERFYRADPSRASAAGGVGLGLAISQQLAGRMGGRLCADYDGEGRLRVRLELPPAAPSPAPTTGRLVRRTIAGAALSARPSSPPPPS